MILISNAMSTTVRSHVPSPQRLADLSDQHAPAHLPTNRGTPHRSDQLGYTTGPPPRWMAIPSPSPAAGPAHYASGTSALANKLGAPLTGHTEPVLAVAVSTLDGQPVAISGSWDSTLRIWDLKKRAMN